MSSTDGDDHIRLSNEILESRRRTRLSRAIATIGFAAGAALTGVWRPEPGSTFSASSR